MSSETALAQKARLAKDLADTTIMYGNFKLASGQKSDRYLDVKKALMQSTLLDRLCRTMWLSIAKLGQVDMIGGPETGAIALTAGVLLQCVHDTLYKLPKPNGFYVRKEPKKHGLGNKLEGGELAGKKVILVDDVITSGGSVLMAADEVLKAGGIILQVTCIVDRLSGAEEKFKERSIPYAPMFTTADLGLT